MAETSDRVASIAGDYADIQEHELAGQLNANPDKLVADIRAMAASCLRQVDREPETKEEDSSGSRDAAAPSFDDFTAHCKTLHYLLTKPLPGGRGFQQQHYREIQAASRIVADYPLFTR